MPETNATQAGDEFDSITLGGADDDVMRIADQITDVLAKGDNTAKAAEAKAQEAKAKEEADAKAKAETEAKAKADAEAAASGRTGEKVDGVLAKDGRNVIPYGVLQAEREKSAREAEARAAAERQAQELKTELERIQSGRSKSTDRADAISAELKAKIESLSETVPEVGEVLGPLVKQVESLTEQLNDVRGNAARAEADTRADAQAEVQAAIDRNPKLSFLQAKDPDMWNRLADQDAVLRADPSMQSLSFDERFSKAIQAIEAIHGEIKVPAEFQKSPPASAQKSADEVAKEKADAEAKVKADAAAKAKAEQDAKARAEAELKKAGERPLTLTDLPGGATPATDDRSVDKLNPTDIEAMVDKHLAAGGQIADIPGLFTIPG